jgi:protein-tyrosine phosphatase
MRIGAGDYTGRPYLRPPFHDRLCVRTTRKVGPPAGNPRAKHGNLSIEVLRLRDSLMSTTPLLTTEQFELERVTEHGYRLRWQPQTGVSVAAVHAGCTLDALTASASIDNANGCAEISDLEPAARHFFRVQFDNGVQLILAERRLALQGSPNFRDFGGYTTRDNRRVRWGLLYRSGHLNKLSDSDLDITAALGIGLICDFRDNNESQRTPNRYAPQHRPRIENLPIMPGSAANVFSRINGSDDANPEAMARVMIEINRDLALRQQDSYQKLFALLAEHDSGILIHCAAGKDRTGFGAALILAALGVPEKTLLHDYLLTQKYFPVEREMSIVRKKYGLDLPDAIMRPMLEVREEYLRAAFDAVHEEYDSLDHYLRDALQVDENMQRELRRKYLEN